MTEYKTIKGKVNSFINKVNKLGTVRTEKNFTCCNSCGHYEMGDTHNYIFYHQQTADSIKKYNTCYFAHYFSDDNIKEQVKLIAQLYGSDWDGSNNKTIEIKL